MAIVNGVPVIMAPPEGYVVDFDNPKRNSDLASYIVVGVGLVISTFFMLQRLYVKRIVRHTFGYDDVLLILAWIGSIAIQGLIIYSFQAEIMGIHAFEIPISTFKKFALIGGYVTSIVYTVPTTLAKIVILLFYKEINNPRRWYHWAVNTMLFVVAGSGIGILFSSMFPCRPYAKAYDLDLANVGWCIDRAAMYQATAGIGVATDFLIGLIPIPMVVGLQMSTSKKAGIILTFLIGSVTVITSVVRLVLLVTSLAKIDQTWGGGRICLWICIEANLLICCASLSTIRQFFRTLAPKLRSSAQSSNPEQPRKHHPSSDHELRTIGSGSGSGRSAYYSRFDESEIGVDTIVKVEGKLDRSVRKDDEEWSSVSDADERPPSKGIVQTKTTDIYYEYT